MPPEEGVPPSPTQPPALDPSHPLALAMRGGRMGWWSRDLATNTVRWSPELEELFGLPPGGFQGTEQAFYDLVHPDDRAAVAHEVAHALAEQRDYLTEFRFRHAGDPASAWRWMEGRGRAIYADNQPRTLYGIGIDITDRRRAEETIRENARQLAALYAESEAHARDLERANHDLSDFAHIAAHDLKEPFRTINFQIGFVLDDYKAALPPEAVARLESIQKVAARGSRLLDELMRFARSGDVRPAQSPVNLGALALEAAATLGAALNDPTIELIIEPGLPEVVCDPIAMHQVFVNLISNGLRYNTSTPRRVRVFAREGPAGPQVCVEDNGVGIPEPRRKDAWRIFKRLHREEDFGPGSGVGLAVVKKVVEAHRGEAALEHNPAGGTIVVISLPRARFV